MPMNRWNAAQSARAMIAGLRNPDVKKTAERRFFYSALSSAAACMRSLLTAFFQVLSSSLVMHPSLSRSAARILWTSIGHLILSSIRHPDSSNLNILPRCIFCTFGQKAQATKPSAKTTTSMNSFFSQLPLWRPQHFASHAQTAATGAAIGAAFGAIVATGFFAAAFGAAFLAAGFFTAFFVIFFVIILPFGFDEVIIGKNKKFRKGNFLSPLLKGKFCLAALPPSKLGGLSVDVGAYIYAPLGREYAPLRNINPPIFVNSTATFRSPFHQQKFPL